MDFFARQAATRRQSRWMVFLFVVAVVAIVIAIDFVVVTTIAVLSFNDNGGLLASQDMSLTRYPLAIAFTTIVVLGVIGISSIARTVSLAAGGSRVAEQLGGTRRRRRHDGPACEAPARTSSRRWRSPRACRCRRSTCSEREAGINAFAAGYSAANAAITVTRGALSEPEPRRAAGRHRARVQPRPERRHADQHAADRPAVRAHGHRDDRAHDPALRPRAAAAAPQGRRRNCR